MVDFDDNLSTTTKREKGGGVKVSSYFSDSSSLDTSCRKVVEVLADEQLKEFTFDGIRRKTGMHQEMLSRTLERLREGYFLIKTSTGYSVTNKLRLTDIESLEHDGEGRDPIQVGQILLPVDIEIHNVIDALKRKWFSNLRWLGYSIIGERAILKWLTEDNQIQIEATFYDGSVQIQARSRCSELNPSIVAANHLLTFILRVYEKQPRPRI